MRAILVPVAGRPESMVALDVAFGLGADLDADVIACHVRPHRDTRQARAPGTIFLQYDDDALAGVSPAKVKSGRAAARKLFEQRAAAHGLPVRRKPHLKDQRLAIWEEFVGSPGRAMAIIGPASDMLVLTRPRSMRSEKARAFMLAAVLHAARPVLVLSPKKQALPGKRIAIAWNQSIEAAHALSAALPLLRRAEAVTIFSCGTADRVGPKAVHAARYLTHWGIHAEVTHHEGAGTPQAIDAACDEAEADLVVMGAYSRGRLRERLFGGITEHILLHGKRTAFVLHI